MHDDSNNNGNYERRIIVCDLDGTLFNASHRAHLAQTKQWDEFHLASIHDTLNEDVAKFIDRATYFCDARVLFITGTNEKYRDLKYEMLRKHHLQIGELWMRKDGDWRSDTVVKLELLNEWLEDTGLEKDVIWMILEDRDKMVEAWRNAGFNCWQVRNGGY